MRLRWLCALLVALLVSPVSACRQSVEEPLLEIVCLDVGQGDSTLLRTGAGDVLVDAGTEDSQESLCRRLRSLGVKTIALVVLTHPDEDHIGGADGVLEQFTVDMVWVNGANGESDSQRELDRAASCADIPVCVASAGKSFSLGGTVITVLSPDGIPEDGNAGSLVLSVCYGEFSFLIMGDADEGVERGLLTEYGCAQLRVDVLHVGHHGSNGSSCTDFLNAVDPTAAVISCGAGNSYGHPDGRALARLEDVGTDIFRTDLLGEVTVRIYKDGFRVGDSELYAFRSSAGTEQKSAF